MESKQSLLKEFLQNDKSTSKIQLARAILTKFKGIYKFSGDQLTNIKGNVNELRQYIYENPDILNQPDKLKNLNVSKKTGEPGYEKSLDTSQLNQSNILDQFEDALSDVKDDEKTIMGQISSELYLEKQYENQLIEDIENQDVEGIIAGKDVAQKSYQKLANKISNKDTLQKLKTVVDRYKQGIAEKKVTEKLQAMKKFIDSIPNFQEKLQQFKEYYREKQQQKEEERKQLLEQNQEIFAKEEAKNQKENEEQIEQKKEERRQQLLMNILNRHNLPNPNLQSIVQSIEQPVQIKEDPSLKYKMINKINQKRVQEENQSEKQKLPDNIQSRISKKTGLKITELSCC